MKKSLILIFALLILPSILFSQTYSEIKKADLNGNDVQLSSLLTKGPVFMSFWALWCSPCKEEMKEMQKIYEKYKDQGFTYLAVNQDNQKSLAKVKSYINTQGYTFPVILDPDKQIFEAYGGTGWPYSLLIDENKKIIAKFTGYLTGDIIKLEKVIAEALSKSSKSSEPEN